jgi:hypothetical protein
MMATIKFRATTKTNTLNAIKTDIDSGGAAGKVRIYSGSMPADPDTAATGTLLAELPLSYPCGTIGSGTLTFSSITQDSAADNSGTAGYFRVLTSANTSIFDGDVSATGGGGMLQLNTTSIVAGGPVLITSMTISIP